MRKTQKADRCYVVWATGVNPVKIRGSVGRDALIARIKARGYSPRSSLLSARRCTQKATLYNRIPGAITIR
jgi:predicted ATP-grasp superfamily ATP-dependent carboligase